MIISANSIVLNEYSDVLLVQRDDTRTLAPPGGACEIDELPYDTAVREVREETGLKVYPVRLVGLYYLPTQPNAFLFLGFRCIQRGGELATSTETPQAGFFATNPLPKSMLAMHKEQVQRSFSHGGGPPFWGEHQVGPALRAANLVLNRLIYPWLHFRRSRIRQPEYVPPPQWQVRTKLILSNASGEILLLRNEDADSSWLLPSSDASHSEPPWTKANQLIQDILGGDAVVNNLSGIYPRQGKPEMEFVFTGNLKEGGSLPASGALFAPDTIPDNLLPDHRSMIQAAQSSNDQVSYQLLE